MLCLRKLYFRAFTWIFAESAIDYDYKLQRGILKGTSPAPFDKGQIPAAQWSDAREGNPQVTRSFDVFFDLPLDKPLSKQSWGWWFETPSRPLWRHCNANPSCVRIVGISISSSLAYIRWIHRSTQEITNGGRVGDLMGHDAHVTPP